MFPKYFHNKLMLMMCLKFKLLKIVLLLPVFTYSVHYCQYYIVQRSPKLNIPACLLQCTLRLTECRR